MSVISVKLRNFQVHKAVNLKLQGKSIRLIGDTREGKSTIMRAILASLGIVDCPQNILNKEADSGDMEVTVDVKGKRYTIKREFDKGGLKRFRMTGDKNETYVWKDEVEKIFGGLNPATSYFDYARYFFEEKSALKRFEYAMQCCVGEQYFANQKRIKELVKRRHSIGAQKKLIAGRLEGIEITKENYDELIELYKAPKEKTEAEARKAATLERERIDVAKLAKEVADVKESNQKFNETQAANQELQAEISDIERQIKALQKLQAEKVAEKEQNLKWMKAHPVNLEREAQLVAKLDTVNETNRQIEEEVNRVYNEEVEVINTFNVNRSKFYTAKQDYDVFASLEKEWTELDDQVEAIKEQNVELFKEKVPLPGLEIKEIKKEAKGKKEVVEDEEEDITYELWYNGMELNRENVSKGETVKITAQIQKALNPDSLRILLIPEGQSMGSDLDEILEEAHKEGYQTIVEITERKTKFEMRFEEEAKPAK